jgi:probable rRNA maturation factor
MLDLQCFLPWINESRIAGNPEMIIEIEVNNKTTARIDRNFIKKIAGTVLAGELDKETAKEVEVSIAFIGSKRMKEVNLAYRKIDSSTDILSFCEEDFLGRLKKGALNGSEYLGEMVIDIGQVKKNALADDLKIDKELAWVVIHGVLHLLGHDHEKGEAMALKMRQKEEHYLLDCFN